MKRKVSFYKEGNKWYADVPFIPKANNLMVAGANTFLDSICSGKDRVTLEIMSAQSPDSIKKGIYYLKRDKHDFWGGTYNVYDGSNVEPIHMLWLCNVTHFVLGKHPKFIGITNISYGNN